MPTLLIFIWIQYVYIYCPMKWPAVAETQLGQVARKSTNHPHLCHGIGAFFAETLQPDQAHLPHTTGTSPRSEERRVGKEVSQKVPTQKWKQFLPLLALLGRRTDSRRFPPVSPPNAHAVDLYLDTVCIHLLPDEVAGCGGNAAGPSC